MKQEASPLLSNFLQKKNKNKIETKHVIIKKNRINI